MGFELVTLVLNTDLPPAPKLVLAAIGDHVRRGHVGSYPSVTTLAEDARMSVRTVRSALRVLEAQGFIFTRHRKGTSSYYMPNIDKLEDLYESRLRERREAREGLELAAAPPANPAGVTPADSAGGGGEICRGPRQILPPNLIPNTNTNTPHTPQPSAGGLAAPSGNGQRKTARGEGEKPMLGMAAWLEQVKAAGQDAIPADDAVWGYAERVGLGRDLVALAWREFKRRQLASRKRQKDWRRAFRNCVEGNWYGLWWMQAGEPAKLASKGEQVRRFFEAEDAAGAVVTGSAAAGEGGEA